VHSGTHALNLHQNFKLSFSRFKNLGTKYSDVVVVVVVVVDDDDYSS